MKLAVLLMTAALAVPAAAQSSTSTSGVVVSSTTESLVVRMDDGTQRTFAVSPATTLPTARLAEGNRVTVQYRSLDAGLFEAARVEIASALAGDRQTSAQTADRSMMSAAPTPRELTTTQRETDATQRETDTQRAGAQADTSNNDNETLPATASPMPMLALSGIAALVAGLMLKARRTA